jgi:hypothetical protein
MYAQLCVGLKECSIILCKRSSSVALCCILHYVRSSVYRYATGTVCMMIDDNESCIQLFICSYIYIYMYQRREAFERDAQERLTKKKLCCWGRSACMDG